MTRTLRYLILCLTAALGRAAAQPAALPSPVRDTTGVVCSEFVYDRTAFPSCHAATIAQNSAGEPVLALFGGTHENNSDCSIYVTRRGPEGWDVPALAAEGIVDGVKTACWNPVLFQIPDGELLLFYKVGVNVQAWRGWVVKSSDGGRTWSAPHELPEGILGPAKNKPLLCDGRLLCGTSLERGGWRSYVEITDTSLGEWSTVGPLSNRKGRSQFIQPSFLRHGDGTLQILGRSVDLRGNIQTVFSHDGGLTWSEPRSTGLPNNDSGLDAVSLADGRFLLVYNHIEAAKQGAASRSPLNVALSDNGIDWYASSVLEDSAGDEYSYPSVIQTSDGLVHIVYTWHRACIKHVVLDPARLVLDPARRIIDEEWGDDTPIYNIGQPEPSGDHPFAGLWRPRWRGTHDLYGNRTSAAVPFRMEYASRGVHTNGKSTLYPAPAALAATFDTTLIRRVARSIAADCRARGIDAALAPELTAGGEESAFAGDFGDTFGSDPDHAALCAEAFARGLREGGTAAIARLEVRGEMTDNQRRAIARLLRSGLFAGIMLRGGTPTTPAVEDSVLIKGFLRGECGFRGLVMADADRIRNAAASFRAGIDTDVPCGRHLNADTLQLLADKGIISRSEIDARAAAIAEAVREFGLDAPQGADFSVPVNRAESRAAALEAARKSLVLLENRGRLLPVKPKDRDILVLGNRLHRNSETEGETSVYPFVRTTLADALAGDGRFDLLPAAREYIDLTLTGEFFTSPDREVRGLAAEYYPSSDLSGTARRSVVAAVDEAWDGQTPAGDSLFSARWSGIYRTEKEQIVRFALSGSGRFRLLVEGREVCGSDDGGVWLFRPERGRDYAVAIEFAAADRQPDIQFTCTTVAADRLDVRMRRAGKIILCTGSDGEVDAEMRFWAALTERYARKTAVIIECCDPAATELFAGAGAGVMAWHGGQSAGQAAAELLTGAVKPSGRMPAATDRHPFGHGLKLE